jgi:hypothetical protein
VVAETSSFSITALPKGSPRTLSSKFQWKTSLCLQMFTSVSSVWMVVMTQPQFSMFHCGDADGRLSVECLCFKVLCYPRGGRFRYRYWGISIAMLTLLTEGCSLWIEWKAGVVEPLMRDDSVPTTEIGQRRLIWRGEDDCLCVTTASLSLCICVVTTGAVSSL